MDGNTDWRGVQPFEYGGYKWCCAHDTRPPVRAQELGDLVVGRLSSHLAQGVVRDVMAQCVEAHHRQVERRDAS